MLKRCQGKPQNISAVSTMVIPSDAKFAAIVAHVSREEYADFRRICALRLKVMEGNAARVSLPPP
jgi:hypothetical protein